MQRIRAALRRSPIVLGSIPIVYVPPLILPPKLDDADPMVSDDEQ